jgi:hypothetical protein
MQPLETSIDSAAGVAGAAPARAEPGQAAQALETSAPAPARQPRSKVLASPGHARHAPSSSRPGRAAAATPECQMHPARPATRLGAQLPTARVGLQGGAGGSSQGQAAPVAATQSRRRAAAPDAMVAGAAGGGVGGHPAAPVSKKSHLFGQVRAPRRASRSRPGGDWRLSDWCRA